MLTFNQVTVTASSVSTLATVPPGETQVVLTGSSAFYVGSSTAVSSTIGTFIPANVPVTFCGFTSSGATPLYAITSTGTATVGITISTPR
jgi:hypothetical protein